MTENIKAKVQVLSYDERWEAKFSLEEDRLRNLLDDIIINVHHIGSTSIPGIYAQPIIDILVEVKEINKVDEYASGMKQLGYVGKGEFGISGRRFFIKESERSTTHHVQFYEVGDVEVGRHVNFRDYLKLHPDVATEYSNLKVELAHQYPYDMDAYTHEKIRFIRDTEIKINLWKKFIEKDLF